jgi:hypothetical protein
MVINEEAVCFHIWVMSGWLFLFNLLGAAVYTEEWVPVVLIQFALGALWSCGGAFRFANFPSAIAQTEPERV